MLKSRWEGCPIHPTRVDLSLIFAIWQTGNRFVNPIPLNRHESFPLLSIRHAGSRFAWDLENIVDLDFEGGLKMVSIRVNSIKSTRIVRIDRSLWSRFKNEEDSCIVISQILTFGGLYRVGWKCCRFESIWSNRHKSVPLLSICHAGSRFARRNSVQIELRRSVRIVKCLRRIDSVWVYWTWLHSEGLINNDEKLASFLKNIQSNLRAECQNHTLFKT